MITPRTTRPAPVARPMGRRSYPVRSAHRAPVDDAAAYRVDRVYWKNEGRDRAGRNIGPAWLVISDADQIEADTRQRLPLWLTIAEARQLAATIGADLEVV